MKTHNILAVFDLLLVEFVKFNAPDIHTRDLNLLMWIYSYQQITNRYFTVKTIYANTNGYLNTHGNERFSVVTIQYSVMRLHRAGYLDLRRPQLVGRKGNARTFASAIYDVSDKGEQLIKDLNLRIEQEVNNLHSRQFVDPHPTWQKTWWKRVRTNKFIKDA